MKKRLLFISPLDVSGDKTRTDGVIKKIILQIETLSRLGLSVDYIRADENRVALITAEGEEIPLTPRYTTYHKTIARTYRALCRRGAYSDYDIVYIRYAGCDLWMWYFLAMVRRRRPAASIIAELPTYMKRAEPGSGIKARIAFQAKRLKDLCYRLPLDYMVTFDDHRKIFGYPTIRIENFVNVDAMPVKSDRRTPGEFHILALAMVTPSHGFDRIIRGLRDYYDRDGMKTNVILHIVGDGSVLPSLMSLAEELDVAGHVIREGKMHGQQLAEIIDRCQVGSGALAIFRKGCDKASELKIREYTARGLPFFYSAYEPQLEHADFCLKIPNDESPVDIARVIDFYDALEISAVRTGMRDFAMRHFTCESQMGKVLQHIPGHTPVR